MSKISQTRILFAREHWKDIVCLSWQISKKSKKKTLFNAMKTSKNTKSMKMPKQSIHKYDYKQRLEKQQKTTVQCNKDQRKREA